MTGPMQAQRSKMTAASVLSSSTAVAVLALACAAEADPLSTPSMAGPLAANPNPFSVEAGPLGKVYVGGVVSGVRGSAFWMPWSTSLHMSRLWAMAALERCCMSDALKPGPGTSWKRIGLPSTLGIITPCRARRGRPGRARLLRPLPIAQQQHSAR